MERDTAEVLMRVCAAILWLFAMALIVAGVAILVLGPHWVQANAMQTQITPIPAVFFTVVAVIFLVLAAADIVVGIGVWNYRSWARIPALVLSVLHLFSFPFGTAFGIFGIWLFGIDDAVKARMSGAAVPAARRPAARAAKKKR